MTQPDSTTYTITEAAALTGLQKNTIRMRVKLGQIPALRSPGKFGEEYRITQDALVMAGLLAPPEPPPAPREATSPPTHEPHTPATDTPPVASQAALSD